MSLSRTGGVVRGLPEKARLKVRARGDRIGSMPCKVATPAVRQKRSKLSSTS